MKIIDAHHHFWDLRELDYPWLGEGDQTRFFGSYASIAHNYLPESYRADTAWTVDGIRPFVMEKIELFGVERCLFASNFPGVRLFSSFDRLFDAITAELTESERLHIKEAVSRQRPTPVPALKEPTG